jgi:hypothetical protein
MPDTDTMTNYRGSCPCGWLGRALRSESAAQWAAAKHAQRKGYKGVHQLASTTIDSFRH